MSTEEKFVVLWNNDGKHDKVYGLYLKDGMLTKVWGRRGKKLSTQKLYNQEDYMLRQISREKKAKGYKEITDSHLTTELEIIDSIKSVLDLEPRPEVIAEAKAKKELMKCVVAKCVSNMGVENHFEVGVEYLITSRKNDKMCMIEDMFGEEIEVLLDRFEVVQS